MITDIKKISYVIRNRDKVFSDRVEVRINLRRRKEFRRVYGIDLDGAPMLAVKDGVMWALRLESLVHMYKPVYVKVAKTKGFFKSLTRNDINLQ